MDISKDDETTGGLRRDLRALLASESGFEVFRVAARLYLDLPCERRNFAEANVWAAGVGGRCETREEHEWLWKKTWGSGGESEGGHSPSRVFSNFVSLPWLGNDAIFPYWLQCFWSASVSLNDPRFAGILFGYDCYVGFNSSTAKVAVRCQVTS